MPVPINVICAIPKTAAHVAGLTGWTRDTRIDARYIKMIATSGTNPNITGGSDQHLHASTAHGHAQTGHGHTWPNTANGAAGTNTDGQGCSGGSFTGYTDSHNHTVSGNSPTVNTANDGPNWSNETSHSPFLLCIFIKSDGTPAGFPADAILYTAGSIPPGWLLADGNNGTNNAVDKILRGAAAGADGGANGGTGDVHSHTQIHQHAQTQHRHVLSVADQTIGSVSSMVGGGLGGAPQNPHNHNTAGDPNGASHYSSFTTPSTNSATDTSTNGSLVPPWLKLLPIQNKNGRPSGPKGVIAFWLESLVSISPVFALCDGTGGTPNASQGLYVMGAASGGQVNSTGGAATHGHAGTGHLHTNPTHIHNQNQSSIDTRVTTGTPPTGCGNNWYIEHSHAAGAAGSAVAIPNTDSITPTVTNANNDPSNITVAFIQLLVDLDQTGLFLTSD